jgi:hypothetical protein
VKKIMGYYILKTRPFETLREDFVFFAEETWRNNTQKDRRKQCIGELRKLYTEDLGKLYRPGQTLLG